jgi:adenylyltransferase/sulfurtransferase
VQIRRISSQPIDLELISRKWGEIGRVQATGFFVRLFPDHQRSLTLFRDGRAVITGTTDISEARSMYDRYVGG